MRGWKRDRGEDAKNEGSETETVNPVQYVLNTFKKIFFFFVLCPD